MFNSGRVEQEQKNRLKNIFNILFLFILVTCLIIIPQLYKIEPLLIRRSLQVLGLSILIYKFVSFLNSYLGTSDIKKDANINYHSLREKINNDLLQNFNKDILIAEEPEINNNNPNDSISENKLEYKKTIFHSWAFENQINPCFNSFYTLRETLTKRIQLTNKNANLNLIIGIVTSVIAISFLLFFLFNSDSPDTYKKILSEHIPRVSLIILTELLSFFFLKLYRVNLDEIKYFQNEITNIDLKLSSLKTALYSKNQQDISLVIKNLSETERNKVIKKGESTTELEKMKIYSKDEANLSNTLIKTLLSKFEKDK